MLVVFVGLLILICCILLLSRVSREKPRKAVTPPPQPVPAVKPPVMPEPVQEEPEEDNALIAAITAAIAAVWDRENTSFQVTRIRRIQNAPAWQRSGREDQLLNHY